MSFRGSVLISSRKAFNRKVREEFAEVAKKTKSRLGLYRCFEVAAQASQKEFNREDRRGVAEFAEKIPRERKAGKD